MSTGIPCTGRLGKKTILNKVSNWYLEAQSMDQRKQGGLKDYLSWAGGAVDDKRTQAMPTRPINRESDPVAELKLKSLTPGDIHSGVNPSQSTERGTGLSRMSKHNELDEGISTAIVEFSKSLDAIINDNKKSLSQKFGVSNMKQKDALKKEHDQTKRNILAIVESMDTKAKAINKIPRWKHKLHGNINPSRSEIVGGKGLLRAIAWGIIVLMIRNRIFVRKRKFLIREKQMSELKLNLAFYADSCSAWFAKLVNVPFVSIENDSYLDFAQNRKKKLPEKVANLKLIQFKVRLRAVVSNITQSLPPDYIIDFLTTFADDGIYFSDSYLWDCEKIGLNFDEYGATVEMLSRSNTTSYDRDDSAGNEALTGNETLEYSRVKMMIKNFLIIRILVAQVTLSPWFKGIVHKPVQRVSKVVYNFRMLASVLYFLCNKIDPFLQPLPPFVVQRKPKDGSVVDDTSAAVVITADHRSHESIPRFFHVIWRFLFSSKEDKELSEIEADVNEDIQNELLSEQQDLFGPIDSVHRFLVSANEMTWLQLDKAEWIGELATKLDKWLSLVVNAVIARKFQRSHQINAN